MLWSTGVMWLKTPTIPSAAATAEIASSSGTPAAASAPKARTRIASVIGNESFSALRRSSSKLFDSALSALASPNCSTRSSGWSAWTRATAASVASTLSSSAWSLPSRSKVTRAERPSEETCDSLPGASGDSTARTALRRERLLTTSLTAALNRGSEAVTLPRP